MRDVVQRSRSGRGWMPIAAAAGAILALAGTPLAGAPTEPAPPEPPLFRVLQDGRWGFIDQAGRVAIAPRFERADAFSEGLAAVQDGETLGYVDRSGALVLVPRQRPAATLHRRFSGGRAAVKDGQRYGYIDRTGALVIPARYTTAEDFSEGLALVCDEASCGYVDRDGRGVLGPGFMGGQPVREGLAVEVLAMSMGRQRVALHDLQRGRLPGEFEGAGERSEGLVAVRTGGRWGYLDRGGRGVIPPRFAAAGPFRDGLAPVTLEGGRCGYVDRTGAMAIPARFRACHPFAGRLARVDLAADDADRERPAFIERTGAIAFAGAALAPPFDSAEDFRDGLAAVGAGGEPALAGNGTLLGYVDERGRWIWRPAQ